MKQTLIIAEDNFNCSKHIYNMIKEKNLNIDVIGIAIDGEETITMIKKYNPNILLLDLNVKNKSGLDVIKELKNRDNIKTKIMIISGDIPMINSINVVNFSIIKGIFIKPFDYEELCSSINQLCEDFDKKNSKQLIDELLHNFCFNFSSTFYEDLISCIDRATVYRSISLKQLYKEISNDTNEKCNKLRWGIEKLIKSMIRYTPKKKIKEFFPYAEIPSVKMFITTISEIVKEKMEN